MHITWYGQGCFKLKSKEATIAIDPFFKEVGLRPLRTKADVLLLSQKGKDLELAPQNIKEEPFVIEGPGEFEVKKVFIEGFDASKEDSEIMKMVYVLKIEGIKICHLGYIDKPLSEDLVRAVDGVDVLFLPVGGGQALGVLEATRVINAIEPRVVIPIHYKLKGLKEKKSALDEFCKEYGVKKEAALDKVVLKARDLPSEGTKVIILKPPQ